MYRSTNPNLLNRPDTLLGVCEGIGQTFGFHPNILRIAFAAALMWDPVVVIGLYLALGAAVALGQWLTRPQPVAAAPEADDAAQDEEPMRLAA